jgi:hypothetical protein
MNSEESQLDGPALPTASAGRAVACLSSRAIAVFVLALTIVACGPEEPGSLRLSTTGLDAVPSALTVPGNPSDRVTDVAGVEITEEEVANAEKICRENAGVPGTDKDCRELLKSGPPCRPNSLICLLGGHVVGRSGDAVLKVVDRRPGSPSCSDRKVELCQGVVVDADVIGSRAGASATKTSTPPTGTSAPSSPAITKPTEPQRRTTSWPPTR